MKRSILLFICLGIFGFQTASASMIVVSGAVSGTWSADTVMVVGETYVPAGLSLTILPGVEVLFTGHYKLIVNAGSTLHAVGTDDSTHSIRFDKYSTPGQAWHGIRFLSAASTCSLKYCLITNSWAYGTGDDASGGGIYCNNSSPYIQNCHIFNCDANGIGGGIACLNNSAAKIINNNISGDTAMFGGGINCDYSNPTITGNTISQNHVSGYTYSSGGGISCNHTNPVISGNTISGNTAIWGGAGIYCWDNANPNIVDNTISENIANQYGGGIECANYSSPLIENCLIQDNVAAHGGGIYCTDNSNASISGNIIDGNYSSSTSAGNGGGICIAGSSPIIESNCISENSAHDNGGGVSCSGSNPTISNNMIIGNSAWQAGGIFCTTNSNASISNNFLCDNSASVNGGGIYCYTSNPSIDGNMIKANSTSQNNGGGIFCWLSSPIINGNCIIGNTAYSLGGGVSCANNSNPSLNKNSFVGNVAALGGGLSLENSNLTLNNSIFWDNFPWQIFPADTSLDVTYCDLQGGWAGIGNINSIPQFVNPALDDYRLLWGSPCIDTGNPNPNYNDPDGTRADMGCYYYDQSSLVRVLLTPHNSPIIIPAAGSSFNYTIQVTNRDNIPRPVTAWCNLTLPNSSTYGPVLGPVILNLAGGQTLSRVRTQAIPGYAPFGVYHYNAFAITGADTSYDSFMFGKMGSTNDGASDWINFGEDFSTITAQREPQSIPNSSLITHNLNPNPFNPSTAISYKLQAASHVSLQVYDTAGRLVETLVNGWREAGAHQITFDGSHFPSGVYLYRLTAGDFTGTGKMVLLK